jgi:hypothetical protein
MRSNKQDLLGAVISVNMHCESGVRIPNNRPVNPSEGLSSCDRDDRNVIMLDYLLESLTEECFPLLAFTPHTKKVVMHNDPLFYSRATLQYEWGDRSGFVRCAGRNCPYCTLGFEKFEFELMPVATRCADSEIRVLAVCCCEESIGSKVFKEMRKGLRENPLIAIPFTVDSWDWEGGFHMDKPVETRYFSVPGIVYLCRELIEKKEFNFEDYCFPRYSADELKTADHIVAALWMRQHMIKKYRLKK